MGDTTTQKGYFNAKVAGQKTVLEKTQHSTDFSSQNTCEPKIDCFAPSW